MPDEGDRPFMIKDLILQTPAEANGFMCESSAEPETPRIPQRNIFYKKRRKNEASSYKIIISIISICIAYADDLSG